ncbi:MFS transporter [Burkholderia cepacia]|uniref:MFS transporter n=1 Tax=Burkholderia cepacia TaxID=292 RepID=UPI0021F4F5BF|nr:MFS transporter [Burkholderia cepacia]
MPRHLLLRAGAGLTLILSYFFYHGVTTQSVDVVTLLVIAGCVAGLANGTFSSVIADMFPMRVRFSGVALAYNIGFTDFSGAAPLIATSMMKATSNTAAPALCMVFCAAITLIVSFFLKPLTGKILGQSPDDSADFETGNQQA